MENSPLIEFDQGHDPNYYLCKSCGTHIALTDDFVFLYTPEPDVTGGVFNKVVNVSVDDEPRRLKKIASHTFADIYCNKCNSVLGIKYIEANEGQTLIKNGMVQLELKMLLKRRGNDYFDGETMIRLPAPDHFMCRNCRNFVALATDVRYYASEFDNPNHISRIVFNNVVNVGIVGDESLIQKVGPHTFAVVYCANCYLFLGWKMIASDDRMFTIMIQYHELSELYIRKLLGSQGDNIVDAEEMIPPWP